MFFSTRVEVRLASCAWALGHDINKDYDTSSESQKRSFYNWINVFEEDIREKKAPV